MMWAGSEFRQYAEGLYPLPISICRLPRALGRLSISKRGNAFPFILI